MDHSFIWFLAGYVSGLLVSLWILKERRKIRRRTWATEQAVAIAPSITGGTKFKQIAEDIYNWTFGA